MDPSTGVKSQAWPQTMLVTPSQCAGAGVRGTRGFGGLDGHQPCWFSERQRVIGNDTGYLPRAPTCLCGHTYPHTHMCAHHPCTYHTPTHVYSLCVSLFPTPARTQVCYLTCELVCGLGSPWAWSWHLMNAPSLKQHNRHFNKHANLSLFLFLIKTLTPALATIPLGLHFLYVIFGCAQSSHSKAHVSLYLKKPYLFSHFAVQARICNSALTVACG